MYNNDLRPNWNKIYAMQEAQEKYERNQRYEDDRKAKKEKAKKEKEKEKESSPILFKEKESSWKMPQKEREYFERKQREIAEYEREEEEQVYNLKFYTNGKYSQTAKTTFLPKKGDILEMPSGREYKVLSTKSKINSWDSVNREVEVQLKRMTPLTRDEIEEQGYSEETLRNICGSSCSKAKAYL